MTLRQNAVFFLSTFTARRVTNLSLNKTTMASDIKKKQLLQHAIFRNAKFTFLSAFCNDRLECFRYIRMFL